MALRQRLLGAIISAATEEGDFDLETFVASESSPEQWIAAASTTPFLSPRRTVIVRMLARTDMDSDQVESYKSQLASLPDSARLVLVGDEDSGEDQPAVIRHWVKAIGSIGHMVDCRVEKTKVQEMVREEVASRGKKMLPTAVQLLVEMCGGSFTASLEELDKLALYVGDLETISDKDVAAVVVPSREWRVYSIINAVLARNTREGLSLLRTIVDSAKKLEDAAFGKVFPPFSRQLRLVWQARVVLDLGGSQKNVPPRAKELLPAQDSILDEQGWRLDQAYRLAKNTSLDRLAVCFEALYRADARLKGIRDDGLTAEETLERMIAEMCSEELVCR